jgi:hypothetical protein
MELQYFFVCILEAASLTISPEIVLAHGGGGHGGGGGGHGFGREAEDTLLSVVVGTDSAVVAHLTDSPAGAFVTDSAGRGDFFLVANHGRFVDRGFRGRDRDFRGRRFRDFDGDFFDFGFYGFGYPDYYQYNYPYYYAYPY